MPRKFISSTRGNPITYAFANPEPYLTIDREFLKSELKCMVEKAIKEGGDVELLAGEYMRALEVDPCTSGSDTQPSPMMKMETRIHQKRCCLYTELRSLVEEVMVEGGVVDELVASCMDTLNSNEKSLMMCEN